MKKKKTLEKNEQLDINSGYSKAQKMVMGTKNSKINDPDLSSPNAFCFKIV